MRACAGPSRPARRRVRRGAGTSGLGATAALETSGARPKARYARPLQHGYSLQSARSGSMLLAVRRSGPCAAAPGPWRFGVPRARWEEDRHGRVRAAAEGPGDRVRSARLPQFLLVLVFRRGHRLLPPALQAVAPRVTLLDLPPPLGGSQGLQEPH